MSKRIAVLYSGGLDSFIMYKMAKLQYPNAQIDAYYFDHGNPTAKKEIEKLPDFVQVRKLDWLDETNLPIEQPGRREGAIMIPGRNLVFGVLLACQELPDEIWMGTLHGETHDKGTDKNWVFLNKMSEVVNYVLGPFRKGKPIRFLFPLADAGLNKLGEVKWALENGVNIEDLINTRSCHDGSTDKCGACIQCFKRWAVFGALGYCEEYDVHPLQSEFGKQFIFDMLRCELGEDNYYGKDTRAEIVPQLIYLFKREKEFGLLTSQAFEPRSANLLERLV